MITALYFMLENWWKAIGNLSGSIFCLLGTLSAIQKLWTGFVLQYYSVKLFISVENDFHVAFHHSFDVFKSMALL
jgi:hypothetical protein